MRRHLFLAFIAFLTTPLLADVPVSDVGRTTAALRSRWQPFIAASDQRFLALWTDERSGEPRIIATRLEANGTALDPTGVDISRGSSPVAVWNGREYLLAWQCGDATYARICTALLRDDDRDLSVRLGGLTLDGSHHDLAWNGSNYLLTYTSRGRSTPGITALLLDREGIAINAPVNLGYQGFLDASVAAQGDGFYIVWSHQYGVAGQEVDARGRPVGEVDGLAPAGARYFNAEIAAASGGYLVVWNRAEVTGPPRYRVEAQPIDRNGSPIAAMQIIDDGLIGNRGLAWINPNYVIAYSHPGIYQQSDIRSRALDEKGIVLSDAKVLVSAPTGAELPAIAATSGEGLVIWKKRDATAPSMMAHPIAADGTPVSPPRRLSESVTEQESPAVARGNRVLLTAWSEIVDDPQRHSIYVARLTPNLEPLDSSGILLSASADDQKHPAAVFDGENFVVGWYEDGGIRLMRIDETGRVIDPVPTVVTLDALDFPIAIATNGSTHLVTWTAKSKRLAAVRVRRDLIVLDAPRVISSDATLRDVNPAVVWTGDYFNVVWSGVVPTVCQITCPSEIMDVRAIAVTPEGFAVGVPHIFSRISASAPAIAMNNGVALIVWTDWRGLAAARVLRSGHVVDPNGVVISKTIRFMRRPSVLWSGESYFIAWEMSRQYLGSDIAFVRVSSDLQLRHPSPQPLAASEDRERSPVLATHDDRIIAVYQRFATEQPYAGAGRIFARFAPEPRRRAVSR